MTNRFGGKLSATRAGYLWIKHCEGSEGRNFLRVFRCLAFLDLFAGTVHCAPDENDRPLSTRSLILLLSLYAVS